MSKSVTRSSLIPMENAYVDNHTQDQSMPGNTPKSPLHNTRAESVHIDAANVTLQERAGVGVVQVFVKGDGGASALGLGTEPGVATVTDAYTALPLSPNQWMLISATGADGSFAESVRATLGNHGYVSEQSQGRVVIRLGGPRAADVLRKGCRLDLHPSVVSPGFCAQTSMAQVGVQLHWVDDSPTYDLIVYSGFARSFWHWLTESAAEYGYHVLPRING